MTDKEKILTKIESLLNETNYEPFTDEVLGKIKSLRELKSYINSLQEEPVSEDLEEAANDYAHDLLHDDVFLTFIAGAQWQKEQMMKDAVYGLVCGHDESSPAWIDLNLLNKPNVKVGTEVKLIIIKDK